MKLRSLHPVALATLALLGSLSAQAQDQDRRTYIVHLAGAPAISYAGGVDGMAATKPAAGTRFNFQATAVQSYIRYLEGKHQVVAASVGSAPIIASYTTALNGLAMLLTPDEVAALAKNPQVKSIHVDEPLQLLTVSTSKFLGLTAPGGLWSKTVDGQLIKGEDVVIGTIDTGISPENLAFADRLDASGKPTRDLSGVLAYGPPPADWNGGCTDGPGFNAATDCNNKLIGARAFSAGFKAAKATFHWIDFPESPRDSLSGRAFGQGGHGTHTASISGGNSNNPVSIGGKLIGDATGMAPRARVAVYKACWAYNIPDRDYGPVTCYSSDTVAAIDRAVQDGVDVINYSISGSMNSVNDPVEQAFLNAAKAGIFVAAAAGNSGPATSVAHISPWITTVAASTHDRADLADLVLGNGSKYSGSSLSDKALPLAPLINAVDAKLPDVDDGLAALCTSSEGTSPFDPAKIKDKIVVCTRGITPRTEKSDFVAAGGGIGMVLVDEGSGPVAEVHKVPTVHLKQADGEAVLAYAKTSGAKASLSQYYVGTKPAPIVAYFSSRGPNQGDPNVLKPDLTAPGVDVIAGFSPLGISRANRDAIAAGMAPAATFAPLDGTSMATPHVAGLAALLKQARPGWSPMAIKSALMTSGSMTLSDGADDYTNSRTPFSQGAGHVTPNKAVDPGLVFDSGAKDWTRYQCNINRSAVKNPADCTDPAIGTLLDTYDLNLPSIQVGTVVDTVTVTRRVTNVSDSTSTYTPTVSNLSLFDLTISPSSLTIAPGETKNFTVQIKKKTEQFSDVYSIGSITWNDGTHAVRIPVAVRAIAGAIAPKEVKGTGLSGMRLLQLQTGYAGRVRGKVTGLKPVTYLGGNTPLVPGQLSRGKVAAACKAGVDTASVQVHNIVVAAGSTAMRFSLSQQDVSANDDDLDLMLVRPDGSVYYSAHTGADESVTQVTPKPGNYRVCVAAYRGAPSITYKLGTWVVGPTDLASKFNVMMPSQVYPNRYATVALTWSGLPAAGTYLGHVQFTNNSGTPLTSTLVVVDAAKPVPEAIGNRDVSTSDVSRPE